MAKQEGIGIGTPEAYINRELSWLHFARRVLELAEDRTVPLLERVKFAGIMGMLYDEFSMKRMGGLRRRIEQGSTRLSSDGRTLREEIQLCRDELKRQTAMLCRLVDDELRPALAAVGIPLLDYADLDEDQKAHMQQHFVQSVQPILTPLAVDVGHPFPFVSNLSLNLAVALKRSGKKRSKFIRIKVPTNRPRWVPLPTGGYVPLEQVIAHNLHHMFPSNVALDCHFFRVTRGAKDDPWEHRPSMEEEDNVAPGSIVEMVSQELTARKFAGVVRVQVSGSMPKSMKTWLVEQLQADPADVITMHEILRLTDLVSLQSDGYAELRDPPHEPVDHPRMEALDPDDTGAIFDEIRRGDILVHHPYHRYDTSILRFLKSAGRDPKVLAIKLTIYRTSDDSPIVRLLTEAAQAGKQVAVLVEITARFDEAPNIAWGAQLQRAGAHVVFGMERLKTHVKLALIVREEEDGLQRYIHVSTGNYHTGTAKLYEDLGMLTCDPQLADSAAGVFNELTAAVPPPDYGPILVAPHNLRARFTEMIRREAEHSAAGRPSGIRAKMNQLQDTAIIRELYLASQAGVPMTLNVRGLCCLRAGVPGLSPTIRVYSTLGRFLEHGRIYRFENGGDPGYLIGSADWMRRNLDSRMETIVPVTDPAICHQLDEILEVYDRDNCSAWDMQPDGNYVRRHPADGEEPRDAQGSFIRLAAEMASRDVAGASAAAS
jgi:polyphosphate kinase